MGNLNAMPGTSMIGGSDTHWRVQGENEHSKRRCADAAGTRGIGIPDKKAIVEEGLKLLIPIHRMKNWNAAE